MEITVCAGPALRRAVITVCGELDISTAADLRHALTAAVAVYEETVIDLAGVNFCDCAGIGTLVAVRNLARRRGHRLRVRRIPGHLQRLLHLTHTRLTDTGPPHPAPARPGTLPPTRLPPKITAGQRSPALRPWGCGALRGPGRRGCRTGNRVAGPGTRWESTQPAPLRPRRDAGRGCGTPLSREGSGRRGHTGWTFTVAAVAGTAKGDRDAGERG
ncbi:STAS domain-containing protein [Streptomyces sp. NPDC005728]|uniref:STAS domain-containing protein n=1 Tax=Streptomyces sp. NPDC005728 TaxID=3157054 RepID=UPI0033C005A5